MGDELNGSLRAVAEVMRCLPLSLALIACAGTSQSTEVTPPYATVVAVGDLPAEALAVDATNVYWTTSTAITTPHPTVLQCEKGACTPQVLESGTTTRQWIAVDSTSVDWITSEGTVAGVARCTIGGCGASPDTVPYVNVWDIAAASPGALWNGGSYVIDSTDVYWVDGRNILTCPIGRCGGAGVVVGRGVLTDTGVGPQIAVDALAVYWHDLDGDIVRCPKPSCTNPTIVAHIPGETVSAIASDDVQAYWVAGGALVRAPVDGSEPPSVLFSGDVSRLALDADDVYFTADTRIMRMPKVAR
jgi:hypothetical protein